MLAIADPGLGARVEAGEPAWPPAGRCHGAEMGRRGDGGGKAAERWPVSASLPNCVADKSRLFVFVGAASMNTCCAGHPDFITKSSGKVGGSCTGSVWW